jgi:hypothetical protein
LHIRLSFFLLALVFSAFAISTFVVSLRVAAQPSPIAQALQAGERAYSELRIADSDGANITGLAAQFNTAFSTLEKAIQLGQKGDETQSMDLASSAENSFLAIITEAQKLDAAATSNRQQESSLRLLSIPLGALLVAVAVTILVLIYYRARMKQFSELRIEMEVKGESEIERA